MKGAQRYAAPTCQEHTPALSARRRTTEQLIRRARHVQTRKLHARSPRALREWGSR